jgi:hypothetical protein
MSLELPYKLRNPNARLIEEQVSASWWWLGLVALVTFLLGGIGGMTWEKQQTADGLNSMNALTERLQKPAIPAAVVPLPKRAERKKPAG